MAEAKASHAGWSLLHPRRLLLEAFREIDAEAQALRGAHAGFDRRPLVAFVVAALSLTLMEYAGSSAVLSQLVEQVARARGEVPWGNAGFYASRWYPLLDLGYWAGFRVLGFFVVPWLAVRLLLRERLVDYGLSTRGLRAHLGTYVRLYLLVLPFVIVAALQPEFARYYPFYKLAGASVVDFAAWELMYALQFLALELFFRGFLLQACRRSMGSHAIFASMVPYCMIHFTKPWPEVLGAMPAGIVLGTLAMRTRSIWGGVALHVAVALTMDVLALAQQGRLPTRLWPG